MLKHPRQSYVENLVNERNKGPKFFTIGYPHERYNTMIQLEFPCVWGNEDESGLIATMLDGSIDDTINFDFIDVLNCIRIGELHSFTVSSSNDKERHIIGKILSIEFKKKGGITILQKTTESEKDKIEKTLPWTDIKEIKVM